jgi:hypothetical protein
MTKGTWDKNDDGQRKKWRDKRHDNKYNEPGMRNERNCVIDK